MKLNQELLKSKESVVITVIMDILVKHFDYSMLNVKSYNDLTAEEKKIISEDLWNEIMLDNNA